VVITLVKHSAHEDNTTHTVTPVPVIPNPVKYYVAAITGAAILVFLLTFLVSPAQNSLRSWFLFTGLSCLTGISNAFPIRIQRDRKKSVTAAAIVVAVLWLDPPLAVLASGLGILGSNLYLRRHKLNVIFNPALYALQTGCAALIYGAIVPDRYPFHLDYGPNWLALPLMAITMYLINSLGVVAARAIHMNQSLLAMWRGGRVQDFLQEMALFVLGIVAASLGAASPWILALLALPVWVVYLSFRRERELKTHTDHALERMAYVVDRRDPYTFEHSVRVSEYARQIALRLHLDPDQVELIAQAGRVHDVGKVATPDHILFKTGPLTDAEYAEIKRHPVVGAEIVNDFPGYAKGRDIILHHHERYNGSGYPHGLRDKEIPLGARIIGVADSYDAMTSSRSYRRAMPHTQAYIIIKNNREILYDPDVVDAFLEYLDEQVPNQTEQHEENRAIKRA
jgi:putative nucleotidyltransferase with HDIG domain